MNLKRFQLLFLASLNRASKDLFGPFFRFKTPSHIERLWKIRSFGINFTMVVGCLCAQKHSWLENSFITDGPSSNEPKSEIEVTTHHRALRSVIENLSEDELGLLGYRSKDTHPTGRQEIAELLPHQIQNLP
jgi:hypothetical protein